MKNLIIYLALATILSACSTGSAIITGKKRPPLDPKTVKVLLKQPDTAEVIGIVSARSLGGFSDQAKEDYALSELKSQAAKIGANAILLLNSGTEVTNGGTFMSNGYGGGTFIPYQTRQATLSAKALYIPPKK